MPDVDNLIVGNLGRIPRRTQCQAAIRSSASTRQLALEDQEDPDLMEKLRIGSKIYIPIVSRDKSLDQSEDSLHLQDSPPNFSYELEKLTLST